MLKACHKHDMVEIEALARDPRVDKAYGSALRGLMEIRGGDEAIRQCWQLVGKLDCARGLDELAQTYEIIKRLGADSFVTVDFSVMSAFDYYTGLVFEVYAPGLGLVLGGGGRYDNMMGAYGKKAPAAGFAFNLDRVMMTLQKQGSPARSGSPDPGCTNITIDAKDPADAFIRAFRLRAQGQAVKLVDTSEGDQS